MAHAPRPPIEFTDSDRLRFFAKCYVNPKTNCWDWQGTRMQKGYGHFSIRRKIHRAHRVAFEMHYGIYPGALFVCHTCDNPACVNPEHLFLGTANDNCADRRVKGRARNPSCKVPEKVADFVDPYRVRNFKKSEYCVKCGHHRTDDIPASGTTPARCRPCRKNAHKTRKSSANTELAA